MCFYVCVLRIHRNSSVHSRLKLNRRGEPAQLKIAHCRRECEPRCECVLTFIRQQRAIFLCVDVSPLVPQLRAALYDIHDIFFDMPLGDRLGLLQQDRELRAERKLRDMVTLKRKAVNQSCSHI